MKYTQTFVVVSLCVYMDVRTIMRLFMHVACGVESQSPLPPPKQAAERLKRESLLAIKNWMEKYGGGYPKLKLGYQYLKYNKKVGEPVLVCV